MSTRIETLCAVSGVQEERLSTLHRAELVPQAFDLRGCFVK